MTKAPSSLLALSLCAMAITPAVGLAQEAVRAVKAEAATMRPALQLRRFPSVLEPPQLVPLSFEVGGRVAEVDLRVGQVVAAGDLLATIEPVDLDIRLSQAQAALAEAEAVAGNARAEATRQEELLGRGVTTAVRRDQAVTAVEQAEARLQQAKSNVDLLQESRFDAELRAPFDAIINTVDIQDFASVQAGRPVVTLYQEGSLQASILVSFDVVRNLSVGQSVQVVPSDGGFAPIAARITEIGRRAPAVSSFPVIVSMTNDSADLRSGMAVDVQFETSAGPTAGLFAIPRTALNTNRSGPFEDSPPYPAEIYVYLPDSDASGVLEARAISVAAAAEDALFVSDGLSEGDLVVTAGVPFLRDGQTVKLYVPSGE